MPAIALRPGRALIVPTAFALSAVLAASAHVSLPFWPVPLTLQPLAVLAIAGLCGPALSAAAFAAYLAEGACGLPVFAGGGGLAYMAGPTGGYLAGQFLAIVFVSTALARVRGVVGTVGIMLAGVATIYACGATWLSGFVGWDRVVALGIAPFVLGDLVKAGIAVSLALLARPR